MFMYTLFPIIKIVGFALILGLSSIGLKFCNGSGTAYRMAKGEIKSLRSTLQDNVDTHAQILNQAQIQAEESSQNCLIALDRAVDKERRAADLRTANAIAVAKDALRLELAEVEVEADPEIPVCPPNWRLSPEVIDALGIKTRP